MLARRSSAGLRCFVDHFPNIPKMPLGSENVSKTDAHDCATTQFRLRKISAPGRINVLDNLAVEHVDLVRRCSRGR